MKRILQTLLILLVLAGLAGGGYWLYQRRTQTTLSTSAATTDLTQIVSVTQGDLRASLTVVGQLEAVQSATLAFDKLSTATNLLTLDVAPGNTVSEGQTLATIDPEPYQQAADEAKTTLQVAQDALSELQTPPTELELAKADADVSKAELDLKQALKNLVELQQPADLTDLQNAVQNAQDDLALATLRQELTNHENSVKSARDLQYAVDWNQRRYWELKDLVASGKANLEQTQELDTIQQTLGELQTDLVRAQSQQALSQQSAAATISNAQLTVSEAQQALAEAQAGADALDVAEAKVAIQKATVSAQQAWEARDTLKAGADAEEIATAEARVAKAKQAVSDAEAALSASKLTAPFAGTILELTADKGDRITSNSNILTLADLKALQVVVSVDETTIRQVQSGQPVQISFDAFPGKSFTGEVLAVPLQGTLQGDVMVYEVTTSLRGAEELPLLVGMTANVVIEVGKVQNALLLPKMALISTDNGYGVLLSNRSDPTASPQPVPVEIGFSDGIYTEIKSGVKVGDSVVVRITNSDSNFFGFPGGGLLGGPPPGGPPPGSGGGGNNGGGTNSGNNRRTGGGG